jgi:hypothetical protein
MPMPEPLRATYCCQFSLDRSRRAAAGGATTGASGGGAAAPRAGDEPGGRRGGGGPPHPGHVYGDSLVSSYLPHARLRLAPALLRLQSVTLSEALRFIEDVKGAFEAGLPPRGNALQEAEPLPQVVVQAYKRHGVPLPYALAAFAPTLSLSCPLLVIVAALRPGGGLRSGPLDVGPRGRHELVAVAEALSGGVRCRAGRAPVATSAERRGAGPAPAAVLLRPVSSARALHPQQLLSITLPLKV